MLYSDFRPMSRIKFVPRKIYGFTSGSPQQSRVNSESGRDGENQARKDDQKSIVVRADPTPDHVYRDGHRKGLIVVIGIPIGLVFIFVAFLAFRFSKHE